ncbi:MAG: AAA family ATPase, partial [Deltaproteobacteria bacterium]|nr:AAA family ATPase [Deltaproteobacteria bacterium]
MKKKDSANSVIVKKNAPMRELPVGTSDFIDIRKCGDYYADKTKFLYKLVKRRRPFFLSRPRRFGKTLLVSSLECLLRGKRELFKGLWIDQSDYDWTSYPVIRLEMNKAIGDDIAEVEKKLSNMLLFAAKLAGIKLEKDDPADMLSWLILEFFVNHGQKEKVAILIDEYDAPIVERLVDPPLAEKIRVALRKFYGRLKTNSEMIGHIFITGVSRFTQTSIFSELNNLKDLTFNRKYAAICGLTAADLEDLLSDREERTLELLIEEGYLPLGSDGRDLRRTIQDWYDGYTWDGKTRV